jgi:hypothetical protein
MRADVGIERQDVAHGGHFFSFLQDKLLSPHQATAVMNTYGRNTIATTGTSSMTVDTLHSFANWALVGSLVLGLLSTYAIVVTGNIKEKELKRELSKANEAVEKAKTDAASANERAADANQKAAALNNRAAILEKEAAQARLETETLKKQFAWRRLGGQQLRIIVSGLSKIKVNNPVVLSAIASDPESMTFAADIQRAMSEGGFRVEIRPSVVFGHKPIVGIEISGPDKEDLEKMGQPFVDAGLALSGVVKPKPAEINLLIGSKPPPTVNMR